MRKLLLGLLLLCLSSPASAQYEWAEGLLPFRQRTPLTGRVVGVVVSDCQTMMSWEKQNDFEGGIVRFSTGGGSYRPIYLSGPQPGGDPDPYTMQDFPMLVGNGKTRKYHELHSATIARLKKWGLHQGYTLVEVEVNDGLGSLPRESDPDGFVGSNFHILEGSQKYPLRLDRVVPELNQKYSKYKANLSRQRQAAANKLLAAPQGMSKTARLSREVSEQPTDLFYVSWDPKENLLMARFLTREPIAAVITMERSHERAMPTSLWPREQQISYQKQREQLVPYGRCQGLVYGANYTVNVKGQLIQEKPIPIRTFVDKQARPASQLEPSKHRH